MDDYGMMIRLSQALQNGMPEAFQWEVIRYARNKMLDDCDWTQMPDNDLVEEKRGAWRIYRKALRDITKNFARPSDVVLPVAPTE